jgi:hypothetical protein
MSAENHEQRILNLEKAAWLLAEDNRKLTATLQMLVDKQQSDSIGFFKVILSLMDTYRTTCDLFKHVLPDEDIRREFDRSLGHQLAERDRLEGMIGALETPPAGTPPPAGL